MIKLRHIGIYVESLEKEMDFYKYLFDMKVVYDETEKGEYLSQLLGKEEIEIHIVKLQNQDGLMIELLKCNNFSESNTTNIYAYGLSHIAVTVDNIDQIYSSLVKKGVEFISKPLLSPFGNAKVCFCKDPEGNYIELVEATK